MFRAKAHDELLASARERAPSHPRVVLESLDAAASPSDVLEVLDTVTAEEPRVQALIECHRALAWLNLDNIDQADAALARARAVDEGMLQVLAIGVNIDLQRFRRSLFVNAGVDAQDLTVIGERALALRERFLSMARHREACRLLMLAADANTLAGRRSASGEIVARATDDERRLDNGDHVLAEAALRALQADTALAVLWPERTEDAERLRIVGQARSLSDDPKERAEGLTLLEEVVSSGGEEAVLAAATRLIRCIKEGTIPWSEDAEALLRDNSEYDWLIRDAKALWLADNGRWEEAEARLVIDLDDPVAQEALLQVYWRAEQDERGADLALRILESGTQDHALRVKCSLALRRVRDFSRVRAEVTAVARAPRAADDVRQFAFRVWFDDTSPDPPIARFEILEAWRASFPKDQDLQVAWNRMDARLRE